MYSWTLSICSHRMNRSGICLSCKIYPFRFLRWNIRPHAMQVSSSIFVASTNLIWFVSKITRSSAYSLSSTMVRWVPDDNLCPVPNRRTPSKVYSKETPRSVPRLSSHHLFQSNNEKQQNMFQSVGPSIEPCRTPVLNVKASPSLPRSNVRACIPSCKLRVAATPFAGTPHLLSSSCHRSALSTESNAFDNSTNKA